MSTDISAMPIRDGRRQVVPTLIVLAALAVLGTALMLLMTRKGIGLWEDSFDYITAAINVVAEGRLGRYDGFGDFRPLTHFPPGWGITGCRSAFSSRVRTSRRRRCSDSAGRMRWPPRTRSGGR